MQDYDLIRDFVQQFRWIASTLEAILNGTPIPPGTGQPEGQVGVLIKSLRTVADRHKELEKQVAEYKQEILDTSDILNTSLQLETETSSKISTLENQLQVSRRRIEELTDANQELKSHIHALNAELGVSQNRLTSQQAESQNLGSKKQEAERRLEDLKRQITSLSDRMMEEKHVLRSIAQISELMSIRIQPEEVLKRACKLPGPLIGCHRCFTYLRDKKTESFMPIQSSGMNPSLLSAFRSVRLRSREMPLLIELLKKKEPMAIEDCRKEPDKAKIYAGEGVIETYEHGSPLLSAKLIKKFEIQSLLVIPLVSRGNVSGIMLVDNGGMRHSFTEKEMLAMDGLGQAIGTSLDNIESYQEISQRFMGMERQSKTTEVLRELEDALASTPQVEQIIDTVVRFVPRVIGCEWVSALLVDKHANGFYVLGNLGSMVRGKGIIPFDQTSFQDALRIDQVIYRPDLENMGQSSPLDISLLSHGVGSDLMLPIAINSSVVGIIHFSSRRIAGFTHEDIRIGQIIAGNLSEALKRATRQRSLDRRKVNGYYATIRSLIETVSQENFKLGDYRDKMIATGLEISRRLDLDKDQQQWIKYGIMLHDIGKSTIPSHILNKKETLNEKEKALLRSHPIKGAEIVRSFRFTELIKGIKFVKNVVPLTRHCYERWDGSGYPDGLAGEAIPIGSRILAVINAYWAMMNDRPYRPALQMETAIHEIRVGAGRQFDPRVVEHFLNYFRQHDQSTF